MKNTLAIIDYGIGGLDLYKMVKIDSPAAGVLYFSDSGFTPYGKVKKPILRQRVHQIFDFLRHKGATHIAVACHSASTVAYKYEKLSVINMKEATFNALEQYNPGSIGIIGGGRTINSRIYRNFYKKTHTKVFQRIAQPLSIIIESGKTERQVLKPVLEKILSPIKHVDALLLACTHYPVIAKEIAAVMSPGCILIDPMEKVMEGLQKNVLPFTKSGEDHFFTTGNANVMQAAAKNGFNVDIKTIKQVSLPALTMQNH